MLLLLLSKSLRRHLLLKVEDLLSLLESMLLGKKLVQVLRTERWRLRGWRVMEERVQLGCRRRRVQAQTVAIAAAAELAMEVERAVVVKEVQRREAVHRWRGWSKG